MLYRLAVAVEAIIWIRNRAEDPSHDGPAHVVFEVRKKAQKAIDVVEGPKPDAPVSLRDRIRETPGQPDASATGRCIFIPVKDEPYVPVAQTVTKNCPKCGFFMTWWTKSNGWYCGKDFLFIPDRNVGPDPNTP